MNRIVLVGNGFDLSLGLKTKYSDFLFYFFKSKLLKSLDASKESLGRQYCGFYDGQLLKILIGSYYSEHNVRTRIENVESLEELEGLKSLMKGHLRIEVKSMFLERIYESNRESGWVDIEQIYFDLLIGCKNDSIDLTIEELNREKENLTLELESYLEEAQNVGLDYEKVTLKHKRIFLEPIKGEELNYTSSNTQIEPQTVYFVNFNYTSTIANISKILSREESYPKVLRNDIHGNLNSLENPMIFGFGDEEHDYYGEIEKLNDNRYLDHIKSFDYLKTTNYKKLMQFLDSANFQVYIYGHSCGLSDRIMLKQIFEHIKCKSIKIFYHKRENGGDDYRTKTQEISRHFSSKNVMRETIVSWELSEELPQIS